MSPLISGKLPVGLTAINGCVLLCTNSDCSLLWCAEWLG